MWSLSCLMQTEATHTCYLSLSDTNTVSQRHSQLEASTYILWQCPWNTIVSNWWNQVKNNLLPLYDPVCYDRYFLSLSNNEVSTFFLKVVFCCQFTDVVWTVSAGSLRIRPVYRWMLNNEAAAAESTQTLPAWCGNYAHLKIPGKIEKSH